MVRTQISIKIPCIMADVLLVAPALALADDLTTTDVIGSPPIIAEIKFPIPCALSSRLVSVILLCASILSEASMQSNVSIEATMAMVAPKIQTLGFINPVKSGKVIRFLKSSADSGTGNVTKCSLAISRELPLKTSFSKIPTATATNAPGSIFIFLSAGIFSQVKRMPNETKVITIAPGEMALLRFVTYSVRLNPSKILWFPSKSLS